MTRQTKIFWVASVFAVVFAAGVLLRWWESNRTRVNVTDEQIKVTLNRELPAGTSKAIVRHFLESKRWGYADEGSTVQTMIRDAAHSFLVRTDIQIQFSFTPEGKLISYEVKDYYTGP